MLKKIGIGVIAVVLLGMSAGGVQYAKGTEKFEQKYTTDEHKVAVPSGEAAAREGTRLLGVHGCQHCHGEDLGGKWAIESPIGNLYGANLTGGAGGILPTYSDEDLERAIRHGVSKDGRGLFMMPSESYVHLSDEELGLIIAGLRAQPAVDRPAKAHETTPATFVMMGLGEIQAAPELIPTDATHPDQPAIAATAAYGAHMAKQCHGCHGADLKGGIQAGPPDAPASSNLAVLPKSWTRDDFAGSLREGKRPDGSTLHPFMPVVSTRNLTDVEIAALWAHLGTL